MITVLVLNLYDPLELFRDRGCVTIENVKGKPLQTATGRVYSAAGHISSKTLDFSDQTTGNTTFLQWTSIPSIRKSFMSTDTENKPRPPKGYVPPVRDIEKIYEDDSKSAEDYSKVGDYDEALDVYGVDTMTTMDCWKSLPPVLAENIALAKYPSPRQIQRVAVPLIIEGMDVVACTETGSGKTLAFLLPIIVKCMNDKKSGAFVSQELTPYALVICPTRELAHQLFEQASKLIQNTGITAAKMYGEYAFLPNSHELVRGCDIIFCTPGRLHHFYKEQYVNFRCLRFLVFDEADLLLGEAEFMDDLDPVIKDSNFSLKTHYQAIFFSATFSSKLLDASTSYMRTRFSAIICSKKCATNKLCLQQFQRVEKDEKFTTLVEILNNRFAEVDVSRYPRTIIFVNSRVLCHELTQKLLEIGLPATRISGNYAQNERIDSLYDFRNGVSPILVTTDLFSRGLDIKDVDLVLNYELPWHIGGYIYRVGRVGRVKLGESLTFIDPTYDKQIVLDILQLLQVAHHPVSCYLDEIVEEVKVNMAKEKESNFIFFDDDNKGDA
uniref:ATP-dependent RNA helicase n=1 Tax=Panagrolaimus sp. PS1159 TaxID=55785 RepID=A0AC35EXC1_9BILA